MKIGFVINSRIPCLSALTQGMSPLALLQGWDDSFSPMSFMRFHWIADELKRMGRLEYALYRPGTHYAAVVFVKSMGDHCLKLVKQLRAKGTKTLFDANVDYYTDPGEQSSPWIPKVTTQQRQEAICMTEEVDQVMASSKHLASVCSRYAHQKAIWIPDNVHFKYVPSLSAIDSSLRPLKLWWSGMPEKIIDFLAVEDALLRFAKHIELNFVTHGRPRFISQEFQERLDNFLGKIPHVFHTFQSIPQLQALYTKQGLIVSPRFLDGPYNLGHSEWKITLGMACGLPALCSPVPSYQDVAERAEAGAITLAESVDDWEHALDAALSGTWDLSASAKAAREVVIRFYSTPIVAKLHEEVVLKTCQSR